MTQTGRSKSGSARAAALTPERRSEIARKAALARHEPLHNVLAGSPDRPLRIGNVEIECYVLDDGSRVLTQASMLRALGRSRSIPGGASDLSDSALPPILQARSLRDHIPDHLIEQAQPIDFRLPNQVRARGYRAELLPAICDIYLAARRAKGFPKNQEHIAAQAEILVRALAHVGIIALVDEATGYQDARAKNALAQILEAYVAAELQRWVKTFPQAYYKELFRLKDLDFDPSSVKKPKYFGHLTNDIVYDRLAPGVKDELKAAQKKADRSSKLHQHLTPDIGHPALREHLGSVVAIMKLSPNWDTFKTNLDRLHPRYDPNALWTNEDFGL
jgi:hypothetical protein